MEFKMFYKINEQCFSNLIAVNNSLKNIETRGESTMLMANIRQVLESTLEQMKADNQPKEELLEDEANDG